MISIIINLREGGFSQFTREIPLFWSGQGKKATLMAAYLTFNMCIPVIFPVKNKSISIYLKLLAGIIFIASLLSVFRLGSRTLLLICILAIIISLIYILPRQNIKENSKLFFALALFIIILPQFVPINLDAEYLSVLGSRLQESNNTSSAGGRTSLWLQSLEKLFEYPFGWQGVGIRYSHNLWLDVARYSGLIPFILLIILPYVPYEIHIKQ
ncbi:O-antigen ligase family protein [Maribacter litoralis]|uniref:O-antigen ligase family protein n=1 Tax=Maribacter litoralis TaxID=2059726 RepID=UPI003F5CF6DF